MFAAARESSRRKLGMRHFDLVTLDELFGVG